MERATKHISLIFSSDFGTSSSAVLLVASLLVLLISSCNIPSLPEFDNPYDVEGNNFIQFPNFYTLQVNMITAYEARSGLTFVNTYGKMIREKGICWDTNENVTLEESTCLFRGPERVNFTVTVTNLIPDTTFYMRSFIKTEDGTVYGNIQNFRTLSGRPTYTATPLRIDGGSVRYSITRTSPDGLAFQTAHVCPSVAGSENWEERCFELQGGNSNFSVNNLLINNLELDQTYDLRVKVVHKYGVYWTDIISTFKTASNNLEFKLGRKDYLGSNLAILRVDARIDEGILYFEIGACHSQHPNPIIGNNCTKGIAKQGAQDIILRGLTPGQTYYARPYMIYRNNLGINSTLWGDAIQLTTPLAPPPCESLTDIDGNVYKVTQRGDTCWMAENLRTTRLNDGTPIDGTSPNRVRFANPDIDAVYGHYYLGTFLHENENLCPVGWRIPTMDDVSMLLINNGLSHRFNLNIANSSSVTVSEGNIGARLKHADSRFWGGVVQQYQNILNSSGFSAVGSGRIELVNGNFVQVNFGNTAEFWSGSYHLAETMTMLIPFNTPNIHFYRANRSTYRPIRCVRE